MTKETTFSCRDISLFWVRSYFDLRRVKLDFAPFELLQAGNNLDGKIPIEYAKEIMPELSPNTALFPPVILDNLNSSSYWKGGKDVCEHYIQHCL